MVMCLKICAMAQKGWKTWMYKTASIDTATYSLFFLFVCFVNENVSLLPNMNASPYV